jgi:hypothetical protein
MERAWAWFNANRARPDTAVQAAEMLIAQPGLSVAATTACGSLLALAAELRG